MIQHDPEPLGSFLQFIEDGGGARRREDQITDYLDGHEQRAIGQGVKNATEQTQNQPHLIRSDESPNAAHERDHSRSESMLGTRREREAFRSGSRRLATVLSKKPYGRANTLCICTFYRHA